MIFGQRIKKIRKRFGLSQERFASLLNVSRQAIIKRKNDIDVPDISNLQEISKVFGVSVDSLLSDKDKLLILSRRKDMVF